MFHSAIVIIFTFLSYSGQQEYPVTWKINSEKTGTNSFEVKFEAFIEEGWVIYGMSSPADGPVATSFDFEEENGIVFEGNTAEITKATSRFEPLFDTEVLKFSKRAIFSQKVSQIGSSKVLNGNIKYMACDGTKCLPPTDVPFVALLK